MPSKQALANVARLSAKLARRRSGRRNFAKGRSRHRAARLFRAPRVGGRQLVIPMKVGYSYDKIGTGAAFLDFDNDVGLHLAPADWLTRYQPVFEYVRINKVRVEVTCPYNIGQPGIGTHPSLFRFWSKKAMSTSEVPPGSLTEWLNMQNAKRTTFASKTNSFSYYFTPGYETTVQPLNVAVTSLRVLYKQWQTLKPTPAEMTPHIGIIGQMHRLDGGPITNSTVFKVNVTLYCQLKGVKQL